MFEQDVNIRLTKAEALVLYDFLSRFSKEERLKIEDQAEERALWNAQCLLERELAELFLRNYGKIIEEARDLLRDKE